MRGNASNGHMTDILFTLALFCVFAASALLVVLIGANVYKTTVERMDVNFDTRTSITYVSTKIHQNDTAGGVYTGELDGVPALILEQVYNDKAYQTWIYHHDGALKEIFTQKSNAIHPDQGTVIMQVESFGIEKVNDNLYRFTSQDKTGRTVQLLISPRCR